MRDGAFAELFEQLFYAPFHEDIGTRSKQRKVERQVGEVADAAAPSLSRFLLNRKLDLDLSKALLAGLAPLGEALVLEDVANPNVSPEEKAEELLAKVPCPGTVEEADSDAAYRVALHAVMQTLMLVGPVVAEWRKVGFATTFELPKRVARRLSEIDTQLEAFGQAGEAGADERFELDYRDYLSQRFHRVEAGTVRMTTNLAVDLRELFVMPTVRQRPLLGKEAGGKGADPDALMDLTAARKWFEQRQRSGDKKKQKEADTRSALEQVHHCRRNVLIGAPGSGKSTFLEWLQLQVALVNEEMILGEGQAIPLLLRVRQLDPQDLPTNGRMIEKATASRDRAALMPPGWLDRMMAAGQVLFLLDGLDEVEPELRDARLLPWLQKLCKRYPECSYLVTSRPVGYPPGVLQELEFAECDLLEFEKEQVSEYTRHWCTAVRLAQNEPEEEARREGDADGKQIASSFRDHPYIRDLASNPLMLSAVCLVNYFEGGTLPDDRALLYRLCVEGLLHNWDQRRGIRSEFGLEEKLRACREVALAMQAANRAEADVNEVGEIFVAALGDAGRAGRLLEHVRYRSGLLLERRAGVYGFAHLTFQEYLAAQAVYEGNHLGLDPEQLVSEHEDSRWREALPLYCGLASSPAARKVVEGLITQGDTITLGEVLTEAFLAAGDELSRDAALRQRVLERVAVAPAPPLGRQVFYRFSTAEVAPVANRCLGSIANNINWSNAFFWLDNSPAQLDFSSLGLRLTQSWNQLTPNQIDEISYLLHRHGTGEVLAMLGDHPQIYATPGSSFANARYNCQAEVAFEAIDRRSFHEATEKDHRSINIILLRIFNTLLSQQMQLSKTFTLSSLFTKHRQEKSLFQFIPKSQREQKELASLVHRFAGLLHANRHTEGLHIPPGRIKNASNGFEEWADHLEQASAAGEKQTNKFV